MKRIFVYFAAVALVFAFVGPAMAADWNFYGSARMTTFWYNFSDEAPSNPMSKVTPKQDDLDVTWDLQGNSRVGATVSSGDVGGGFEYGTGVNVRKLYGTWNFGGGELLFGQTYTPITHLLSNQVGNGDNGLLNVGELYAGRQPMAQVTFGGDTSTFKIALINPEVTGLTSTTTLIVSAATAVVQEVTSKSVYGRQAVDTDVIIPKIELNYRFKADMFSVDVYGGYQTYDAVDSRDNSDSVTSYVFGGAGIFNFGAGYAKANLYYAQNSGAYGATAATAGAPADAVTLTTPTFVGAEYKDSSEMGGLVTFGWSFSDMLGFEVGGGYVQREVDTAVKTENTVWALYANLPITLADGVFIVPEIGTYDFGDQETGGTKVDQGSLTYFGAKWQINF